MYTSNATVLLSYFNNAYKLEQTCLTKQRDPDQMPQIVASDQGLHSFHISSFDSTRVECKTVVNTFLKPLFRGNFDPFVNNAKGAIAPLLIRAMAPKFPLFTERYVVIFITPSWWGEKYWEKQPSDLLLSCDQPFCDQPLIQHTEKGTSSNSRASKVWLRHLIRVYTHLPYIQVCFRQIHSSW